MESAKIEEVKKVIKDSLTEFTDLGIELSFEPSETSKFLFTIKLLISTTSFGFLEYLEYVEYGKKFQLAANRFSTEYGYTCVFYDELITFEYYGGIISLYVLESNAR